MAELCEVWGVSVKIRHAAGIVAASIVLATSTIAGATSGNHPPRAGVHVVDDGIRSCNSKSISTWYRYSNGYTWNLTERLAQGSSEFILRQDPQGRPLAFSILVNYTPLICVTDVLR